MAERVEYELTEPEADQLLEATREYVGLAGEVGGIVGSQPGWAAENAKVGSASARFSVRFTTRPRSAAATVDLPYAPPQAHERARACLEQTGFPIEDPNGAGDGSLWAVLPSGTGGTMPALVRVDVQPAGAGSRVVVRATGREGLIKQGIASKAVDRVIAAVSGAGP